MNLTNAYPSLAGKLVLITGGATGIGAGLVEAFSLQRARVVFVDILRTEGQQLVTKISALAGASTPEYIYCDLTDIPSLKAVIADIEQRLGPIAVLLNNAACDTRHDYSAVTEAYWEAMLNVNLRHVYFAIQAVSAGMKTLGGGSIINFGSVSWYRCQANLTCYATSKAALEGMTRSFARDLGVDGIRVNTLIPGWVMTERQLRDWVNAETLSEIHKAQCLKPTLQVEDVCAMALFLASNDSKMCTAQNFIVDGGWI
jgi:NAD(P)-dependent dehydrogenase (short-subunit alcohol dehydrogenase family)